MNVPFLPEHQIEREAAVLLAQFRRAHGKQLELPIPVEALLETHLQLTLGFDDLHRRFSVPRNGDEPDLLGALFVRTREVLIHDALDPEVQPDQEGRFRFTVSHEIGHWELHRDVVASPAVQQSLFGEEEDKVPEAIVCRSTEETTPIEWQANRFAAALLMPPDAVIDAWAGLFGSRGPCTIVDATAVRKYMRALARKFLVSTEAMRIRCEQLGLLYRTRPAQQFLRSAS